MIEEVLQEIRQRGKERHPRTVSANAKARLMGKVKEGEGMGESVTSKVAPLDLAALSAPLNSKSLLWKPKLPAKDVGRLSLRRLLHGDPLKLPLGTIAEEVEDSPRWDIDSHTFARQCEGKLEDMLKRSQQSALDGDPYSFRIHACCQILNEICKKNLPFSSALQHIRDELELALFCNNTPSHNLKETYYEAVSHVEEEKSAMEADNACWRDKVFTQQADVIHLQEQIQELKDEQKEAAFVSKDLEDKISAALQATESGRTRVSKLREKISYLKKELKEIRSDVHNTYEAEKDKDADIEEYEKLKEMFLQLTNEYQHVRVSLNSANNELAERAPNSQFVQAKIRILELQRQISETQARVDKFVDETRDLSPRPKWVNLNLPVMSLGYNEEHPNEYKLSTIHFASKICKQNLFLKENILKLESSRTTIETTLRQVQEKHDSHDGIDDKVKIYTTITNEYL